MVRGCWPCQGSRSHGGGSSSRSYKLMDELDTVSLDDHVPTTPLGDDVDPDA